MSRRKTSKLTWSAAVDAYETHLLASRASPATVKAYMADLVLLQKVIGGAGPWVASPEVLRAAQHGLLTGKHSRSGKPLAAQSVLRIVSAWRAFYGFLLTEEKIATDPAARVELPRVGRKAPGDTLTVKEVERLLDAPDALTPAGLRDRAVLDVLFSTGVRNAEVCGFDLCDLDDARRELLVRGKGDQERIVPLTRMAYERVQSYLDDGRRSLTSAHADSASALFLTTRGRRIHPQYLLQLLRRCRAVARIKRNVTPHTLRRTCATVLLESGASLRHIQALLGHSSLDVTMVYLRLDREKLRRELLLRHPRERLDV